MARNMYGATSADFTLTSGGRVVPGATLTIWSARTGGTQITDLLDKDSVATTLAYRYYPLLLPGGVMPT